MPSVQLTGFQGIGALGGGNVTILAGGNAGNATDRAGQTGVQRGEGIIVAVGGTGRVLADGTLVTTGGGNETVRIGGTLNPLDATDGSGDALNGDFHRSARATSRSPRVPSAPSRRSYYGPAVATRTIRARRTRSRPTTIPARNIVTSLGGPNVLPGDATVEIGDDAGPGAGRRRRSGPGAGTEFLRSCPARRWAG